MQSIWGLATNYKGYSLKAEDLFHSLIDECRIEFRHEFKHALEDYRYTGLYASSRFNDNRKLFWSLQSNVSEADFTQLPKHYITRVLLGACEADYYYQFEKEW